MSSDAVLNVRVLGQLVVTRDGQHCELPASRKTRGLLAYLALAQRPCRRDELCDLLWEGASNPKGELRWSLAKIKLAIGSWLRVLPNGCVGLASERVSVDCLKLRSVALQPLTEASIADALALWRDLPLADVEVSGQPVFQAWLAAEREALAQIRANLLKAAVDLAWTRPEDALGAARRLVAAEPWNEWGHARVVQLLERCGRVGEAAGYAAATRCRLSRELGVTGSQLLLPPSPPQTALCDHSERKPAVRLEPLKFAPHSDRATVLSLRISAALNAALWRRNSCIVLDGDRSGFGTPDEITDAAFAVRGTVSQAGHCAHVSLRCIDMRCGAVVWSDDAELAEVSMAGVQQWVERAVEAIDVTVRVASRKVEDEDSPKARIRKAGALAAALNLDANRRALALLDEILHEDPDEPLAAALASWCYAQRVVYNWSNDFDRDKTEAKYFAASATQAGLNDAPCLTTIATARTLIGDANAAQVLLERAMYLNGRLPAARTRMGWLANYSDAPRDAIRHFRAAIKLAPTDPSLFNTLAGLGVAHFIDGDHTQAIRHMEQALALNPKAAWIYRNLVPAYTAAGDRHRAEDGVAVLLGNYPRLTAADVTDAMVFSAPVMAQISKGLREAGLAP